ncbi:hypothetical protein L1987_26557 [Smallanthus sonchifolius]|uniref:Uncharacterized protein n=1 Tax=Smallanthus sonchifolius TaxID=185202 RepID=A0ACB9IB73_9ASTR|nr:hypothetical protein L1987_26557 [Smallanthus sonchifolius]
MIIVHHHRTLDSDNQLTLPKNNGHSICGRGEFNCSSNPSINNTLWHYLLYSWRTTILILGVAEQTIFEIKEKINQISWCHTASGAMFLHSFDNETIRFKKKRSRKCHMNIDPHKFTSNGFLIASMSNAPTLPKPLTSNGVAIDKNSRCMTRNISLPSLHLPMVEIQRLSMGKHRSDESISVAIRSNYALQSPELLHSKPWLFLNLVAKPKRTAELQILTVEAAVVEMEKTTMVKKQGNLMTKKED